MRALPPLAGLRTGANHVEQKTGRIPHPAPRPVGAHRAHASSCSIHFPALSRRRPLLQGVLASALARRTVAAFASLPRLLRISPDVAALVVQSHPATEGGTATDRL